MKVLGKITDAEFGFHSDRDFLFGLKLCFALGEGGGVCDGLKYTLNMGKACKWESKKKRQEATEWLCDFTYNLLQQAKVDSVSKLVGKPVELEMSGDGLAGSHFKDFRILTEVL